MGGYSSALLVSEICTDLCHQIPFKIAAVGYRSIRTVWLLQRDYILEFDLRQRHGRRDCESERLGNGNIDFSFLVIFCLPLLLIIMTYDIGGLEKDERFERLIDIQFGSWLRWLAIRFAFYVGLLIWTVALLMFSVVYINKGEEPFQQRYLGCSVCLLGILCPFQCFILLHLCSDLGAVQMLLL